jgi:low affinity Fe/Cu permease
VTFVMVFVIQHTPSRQISAMQRKLDELLRSHARADDALIAAEEAPDEEIQAMTDRSLADREHVTGDQRPRPLGNGVCSA